MTTDETQARALAALRVARPRQFEAVEMLRRGMRQTDIAAQLGVTQGRVSKLLARAASNLEKLLTRINAGEASKRNNS